MTHPFFADTASPRVLAHRGLVPHPDAGFWENTAAAFAAAHAAGAQYIESDCQVTADGDVVLVHDETLERLTGDPRRVSDVGTAELERMFAAHGGLMTVAAALDALPETKFNLDVKTMAAAEPLGRVLAPHTDRVLVTSFSDRHRRAALDAVMRAGASLRPATSAGSRTISALLALSTARMPVARVLRDVDAVQIPERHGRMPVFTRSLVRAAHRAGVEVHVWTVNDAEDMRRLVTAGADGIVTDRADLALQTLERP